MPVIATKVLGEGLNDTVMTDADTGWRSTPHGMRTIAGCCGVGLDEIVGMPEARSHPHTLTAAGRARPRATPPLCAPS